jgi:hypothetical protein
MFKKDERDTDENGKIANNIKDSRLEDIAHTSIVKRYEHRLIRDWAFGCWSLHNSQGYRGELEDKFSGEQRQVAEYIAARRQGFENVFEIEGYE